MNNNRRVVITGLGVVSSIGTGVDLFWENLKKGKSGTSIVKDFDTTNHNTHIGGEIIGFDFHKHFRGENKNYKFIGRASQLALVASKYALEDAGIKKEEIKGKTISVCMGTTMGEIRIIEKLNSKWIKEGEKNVKAFPVHKALPYNIPSIIALEYGLLGEVRMFTTACAAGNYAIDYAYDLIQSDKNELVLAGGSDAMSWISFSGFNKVMATAPDKCQPFDKNRKGMIPAEGAGVLVVESLEHAQKRNARIYAEVLGCGLSCDAHHMTLPSADGISRCLADAVKRAGINTEDVDYICAHGTGTQANDKAESAAIKTIFKKRMTVNSIKSMLGHTMGAASAIEAIACCLSIKDNIIPPTINFETPDPECDVDCVPNEARNEEVNIVLNNGMAFGGNNSSLVLGKYKA